MNEFLPVKIYQQSIYKVLMRKFYEILMISGLSLCSILLYFALWKRKQLKLRGMISDIEEKGYLLLIKLDHCRVYQRKKCGFARKQPKMNHMQMYAYPSGVVNFGNNCYVNVLFQCLACCPEFIWYISALIDDVSHNLNTFDLDMIIQLKNVISSINSSCYIISPYDLITTINEKYAFAYEQQDSYELFHRINELFDMQKENIKLNMTNPFLIQFENTFDCLLCENKITKIESNFEISLIPQTNSTDIQMMLQNIFHPSEITDYTCVKCTVINIIKQIDDIILRRSEDKCLIPKLCLLSQKLKTMIRSPMIKSMEEYIKDIVDYCDGNNLSEALSHLKLNQVKSTLRKTLKIKTLPQVMAFHVQRVFFNESASKNNSIVLFPFEMTFKNEGKSYNYELVSIIEHLGSHDFGHYNSYRKFYSKWAMINDTYVRPITQLEINKLMNPYMLFYRQI